MALDADLAGVNGLVGLKIIESAAGSPGPGTQRAPVVGLARLALVAQADDALGEPGSVVGLNAGGDVDGVSPAPGKQLLLPGGAGIRRLRRQTLHERGHESGIEGKFHHHRDGAGGVGGGGQRELNVDGDEGIRRVVDVAYELLRDDWYISVHFAGGAD